MQPLVHTAGSSSKRHIIELGCLHRASHGADTGYIPIILTRWQLCACLSGKRLISRLARLSSEPYCRRCCCCCYYWSSCSVQVAPIPRAYPRTRARYRYSSVPFAEIEQNLGPRISQSESWHGLFPFLSRHRQLAWCNIQQHSDYLQYNISYEETNRSTI